MNETIMSNEAIMIVSAIYSACVGVLCVVGKMLLKAYE
jgi:hypothetical protein